MPKYKIWGEAVETVIKGGSIAGEKVRNAKGVVKTIDEIKIGDTSFDSHVTLISEDGKKEVVQWLSLHEWEFL